MTGHTTNPARPHEGSDATNRPAVRAYLAVSLDGFVADDAGGVSFLDNYDAEELGATRFFESIDALVMGRKSFDQVLSFGDWPYEDRPTWVVTSRPLENPPPHAIATPPDPQRIINEATKRGLNSIWLVGGPATIALFDAADRIDTWELTVVPERVGAGIPLFTNNRRATLTLENATPHPSGVVQLDYRAQPATET